MLCTRTHADDIYDFFVANMYMSFLYNLGKAIYVSTLYLIVYILIHLFAV